MLTLRLAVSEELTDAAIKLADVNGDGAVTSSDAMRILNFVTGAISKL